MRGIALRAAAVEPGFRECRYVRQRPDRL